MGVLRQSCGGSSSGTGISNVTISGCLNGSGIPSSPLSIKIDPTGLIGCGADGLKLLNAPSGGGAGTPASPLTSVQFNNGGAFGGSSGLTWDGTNLKITGGGIQIDGTTNLYPMLTNSASTTSEMQARLADNSDLANFRAKFIYLDATGIRFNAAGNGIGVITQADGLDFARFCFGGTTSLFPALKKVGTSLEVRLADDSAYTALRTASINLSTDVMLERDAANNLAIRNSNASQALRVYKNYNSSVSYERGVFDWQTTSGTLRIGTENAGAGNVATPLAIVTSGTPRISITSDGIIQFNQAYTFPTGVGASGQALVYNGLGGLRFSTPTGVGGAGSPSAPVNSIQFNNAGSFGGSANLTWDGNCVMVSGVTTSGAPILLAAQNWFGPANTAYSGVVLHFIDPSSAAPDSKLLQLQLNGSGMGYFTKEGRLVLPNIGNGKALIRFGTDVGAGIGQQTANVVSIYNNTSGELFRVDGSASTTYTFTNALSVGSTDVLLSRDAANSLGVRNSNASQRVNIYKNYNSGSSYERGVFDWQTTSGTLRIGTEQAGVGNIATPLAIITSGTPRISIAASGAITFNQAYTFPTDLGTSGQVLRNHGGGLIKWGTVSGVTSLAVSLTGGGTHADPTTAVSLVYNNSSGTNVIDFRPLIYFNFGQAGTLSAEGAITDQPRFIVPEGFQIEICRAYLSVGSPGDDVTSVQLQRYVPITGCGEPSTDGTPFSKDLDGGCTFVRWTEVEGITLDSLAQLNFRVLTPGTNAMNLVAHFWARTTVCYEP